MTAKTGVRSVFTVSALSTPLPLSLPPLSLSTRYAAEWLCIILPERLGIVRVTHACLTKKKKKPPENALSYCILIIFDVFLFIFASYIRSLFTILCIWHIQSYRLFISVQSDIIFVCM